MKLVELLAKELREWPEDGGPVVAVVQDPDMMAYVRPHDDADEFAFRQNVWIGVWHNSATARPLSDLATDHATAIVTRADWEAERAKMKALKANGDGWVRHRGGRCPVEADQPVSVRHRDGQVYDFYRAANVIWRHSGSVNDVMAWKIYKPAEQQERADIVEQMQEQCAGLVEQANILKQDGPLEWRDRIRELDTQRAEVESTYQRQISEITQERESLVQKLAGEGLALVEVVVQPVEDMSDWRNWKAGDLITCMTAEYADVYEQGKSYAVKEVRDLGALVFDDCGAGSCCSISGRHADKFKWHSRPGK